MSEKKKFNALIGFQIRKRREDLGITQSELGRAIGITGQSVAKLETGHSSASTERLWHIARKLNVTPSYFFLEVDKNTDQDNETEVEYPDRTALELVREFKKINNERTRKSILHIIKTITSDVKGIAPD